jgi:hypothetical protein
MYPISVVPSRSDAAEDLDALSVLVSLQSGLAQYFADASTVSERFQLLRCLGKQHGMNFRAIGNLSRELISDPPDDADECYRRLIKACARLNALQRELNENRGKEPERATRLGAARRDFYLTNPA